MNTGTATERFVTLDTIAQGAAIEMFQDQLTKVLENILDPNTKAEATREVRLKVTIKPNGDRSAANITIGAEAKVAPQKPIDSTIYIGRRAGNPVASERASRGVVVDDQNVTNIKEKR